MRPVLIALLAALVVAPAAHAEPRFRDLGPTVDGVYTDGHRWAAWMPVRGKLTLFDTETGRAWTQPVPTDCVPADVGGGMLLLRCESSNRPLLVDLQTGASWEPPGVDAVMASASEDVAWAGVGRHWLRFQQVGPHWAISYYLELATGRVVEDPPIPAASPRSIRPGCSSACARRWSDHTRTRRRARRHHGWPIADGRANEGCAASTAKRTCRPAS